MATTAADIFNVILYDLCEDPPLGPILGIVTAAQLLDLLNLTITDFFKETGLYQRVWTQSVFAGQSRYTFPDDLLRAERVFLAGRFLPPAGEHELSASLRDWRRVFAKPTRWHADGLPPHTIELVPAPSVNSSYIPGASEPEPPHAIYDSFSATVLIDGTPQVQTPAQHKGLTIVGPCQPVAPLPDTATPLQYIADDWAMAYLPFGVLERIFAGDNELKDLQRALYCHAQWAEGVALAKAITGEPDADT